MATDLERCFARARTTWQNVRTLAIDPRTTFHSRCCTRWLRRDGGLSAFVADVGLPSSPEMVLCRPDSRLPWGPDNAVWLSERPRRRRARALRAVAFGLDLALTEWAQALGITYLAVYFRLRERKPHQSVEEVLLRPLRLRAPRRKCGQALEQIVLESIDRSLQEKASTPHG